MVSLLWLAGCAGEWKIAGEPPVPTTSDTTAVAPAELASGELLLRLSMDLRGVRPTVDEILAFEADPSTLEAVVDSWLRDPRYGSRVRAVYADAFLTRQDYWYVTASDYGLEDEPGFAVAVGEEPLQIVSTVAEQDLPYTEVVTGDWTMANEILGAAWPLDYPEGAEGWQQVSYTDGRPTAGVLTTNGFWWRYMSSFSNANRGRANAVSRALLCTDYLSKPIEFDRNVNILDGDALQDALANNPGCVACHYSLDPLAAYFWGFFYYDYTSPSETTSYHAERESLWDDYAGGVGPAYYGDPGFTLTDLGRQLADDPRLTSCAVERVWEGLLQRETTLEDTESLLARRADFEAGGLTLRSLWRSVVLDPAYRVAPSEGGRRMVSPELLASSVEDLTGFRFEYAGYDMLTTDTYGLRTLAGGVDGQFVTSPARAPTATLVLVQQRLAEGAAHHVVAADRADRESARLFTEIGFTEMPGTDRELMVRQLQLLHLRLFATHVEADGPEVEANLALWEDLYAVEHDPAAAWEGVLAVLLRDPLFLTY